MVWNPGNEIRKLIEILLAPNIEMKIFWSVLKKCFVMLYSLWHAMNEAEGADEIDVRANTTVSPLNFKLNGKSTNTINPYYTTLNMFYLPLQFWIYNLRKMREYSNTLGLDKASTFAELIATTT
jgi:hypothetical protein